MSRQAAATAVTSHHRRAGCWHTSSADLHRRRKVELAALTACMPPHHRDAGCLQQRWHRIAEYHPTASHAWQISMQAVALAAALHCLDNKQLHRRLGSAEHAWQRALPRACTFERNAETWVQVVPAASMAPCMATSSANEAEVHKAAEKLRGHGQPATGAAGRQGLASVLRPDRPSGAMWLKAGFQLSSAQPTTAAKEGPTNSAPVTR